MLAGAIQMEEYQGLLTYSITNPTLTWARMFGMMEHAKRQLNIEDYSLGQTSLEQVSSFFNSSFICCTLSPKKGQFSFLLLHKKCC